jgi:pheromone shutdown protein TraB
MKRVSVVFTVHEEKGRASVSELLAILERIQPEVIFLEIPPAAFPDYSSGKRKSLESTAARHYRENHRVELIPVDLPTPEQDYLARVQELSERIDDPRNDCRRLVTWHSNYVRDSGFAYLNSERCSTLLSQLHDATLAALAKLSDRRPAELYELWIRTDERRDRAMMNNIINHCRQASFSRAAFLVGAAHRQSISDLLRGELGAASSTIQWDLGGPTPHSDAE